MMDQNEKKVFSANFCLFLLKIKLARLNLKSDIL